MAELDKVRVVKHVTAELGGRVRTMKFDMNAFAELERMYGTIQDALTKLTEGRIKDVRKILWAALVHDEVNLDADGEPESYNITPYQVGGWVEDPASMTDLITKLIQALDQGSPTPDPEVALKASASKGAKATLPEGTATEVLTAAEVQEKNA
jgi:hypothetical protein